MPTVTETLVQAANLKEYVRTVAETVGLSPDHARVMADTLVEADLRNVHTHGVNALTGYARRLQGGGANPKPNVRLVKERLGVAVVDGDAGMGQIVAHFAMTKAIERARQNGIGAVAARNSSHFGAAAYYAAMALEHDMIGFATTSAGNRIAPIGGKTPVVGNNPLAWAIPAGQEQPFLLDMAQSVVAAGKLGMAARKGERIPLGWALDKDGKPTDDPRAGSAGLLVPIGGPKGFGLAIVMDVLSGALSGAAFGRELARTHQPDKPSQIGHFFMAIDVGQFEDVATFKARVDRMIRDVKDSEPAEGARELFMPGEMEWNAKRERLQRGVPLLTSIVDDLEKLAAGLGLDGRKLLGVT
jgi:LDH2 family malate/lactate/ureidoglycolate dehydrogenase